MALGREGEDLAAAWYERRGYAVLDRNWRVREGEIDLLAMATDGTLVVSEVKTRSSARFGTGAEAVHHRKQQTLRTLALAYLRSWPHAGRPRPRKVRFDVAVVSGEQVEVIEGAF
jgi:putative endonuclease